MNHLLQLVSHLSIMKMPFDKKLDLSYASCSRLKLKA